MLRIVLIRPGATDYDCEERIQGALDIPLNRQGLMEVARTVDQLRDKRIEIDLRLARASRPSRARRSCRRISTPA